MMNDNGLGENAFCSDVLRRTANFSQVFVCGAMYDTDYRVYVAPSSRWFQYIPYIYGDVSQSVRRIYMTRFDCGQNLTQL